MNTLIVLSYPDLAAAHRALAELDTLRDRHVVALRVVTVSSERAEKPHNPHKPHRLQQLSKSANLVS